MKLQYQKTQVNMIFNIRY